MELWIRSQDKKRLIKATNDIYFDDEFEYNDEKYAIKCGTIDIGYYTYDRGFEVLDEIQHCLIAKDYLDKVRDMNKLYPIIFFNMPKE